MISEFWQGFLIGGLVGSPTLIVFCWLCGKFNIWLYRSKKTDAVELKIDTDGNCEYIPKEK